MKRMLLWLWQLPQNLIGLAVVLFTKAKWSKEYQVYVCGYNMGVSLGNYIILGGHINHTDIWHEQGHQKQSQYLGPLYLLIIGLPSLIGNIYDRIAHKHWDIFDSYIWYYKQPWERWADKLAGVTR